ncbi:hypothetical protein ACFL16_03650 [Patescibacteria group bacterium]
MIEREKNVLDYARSYAIKRAEKAGYESSRTHGFNVDQERYWRAFWEEHQKAYDEFLSRPENVVSSKLKTIEKE